MSGSSSGRTTEEGAGPGSGAGARAPALLAHHPPLARTNTMLSIPLLLSHGIGQPWRVPTQIGPRHALQLCRRPARPPHAVLAQARRDLFSRAQMVPRPWATIFRATVPCRTGPYPGPPACAAGRARRLLHPVFWPVAPCTSSPWCRPIWHPGGMVATADSGYWAQRAMAEAGR